LRDDGETITLTDPPGSYWYQIGTVSGGWSSTATLITPTWRSARRLLRNPG